MIKHLVEVYYRAWKKATGEFKERIESVCIQDLMKNAILLQRSSPVLSKVRMVGDQSFCFWNWRTSSVQSWIMTSCPAQILNHFHSKKGCDAVDAMLNNLYKPILWKSLSVRRQIGTRTRVQVFPFAEFSFLPCQVPNFEVRANAALLFTEAFPIHDPSHSSQAVEAAIQKQLDTAMV